MERMDKSNCRGGFAPGNKKIFLWYNMPGGSKNSRLIFPLSSREDLGVNREMIKECVSNVQGIHYNWKRCLIQQFKRKRTGPLTMLFSWIFHIGNTTNTQNNIFPVKKLRKNVFFKGPERFAKLLNRATFLVIVDTL